MEKARLDFDHGYFEWCCFTAQQSSEKAVKALAMKLGYDVWGHSVTNLFKLLEPELAAPIEVIEAAQLLDTFYIPTRYPNGFSIGKPMDYYNRKMAGEALDACGKILRFCKDHLDRP